MVEVEKRHSTRGYWTVSVPSMPASR
jgi:hypothetical protein